MPTLEAEVETEQASRYLVQFCRHAAAMGGRRHTPRMHAHLGPAPELNVSAEWSTTTGTVQFGSWGRCSLAADDATLTLRITAAEDDGLNRIRDIVTRDFERFARRRPLTLTWRRSETHREVPSSTSAEPGRPRRRRPRLRTVLLAVAVVVIIALHLGLAGTLVARSPWTGMAGNVVVALVVLKVTFIALARVRLRRRREAAQPPPASEPT